MLLIPHVGRSMLMNRSKQWKGDGVGGAIFISSSCCVIEASVLHFIETLKMKTTDFTRYDDSQTKVVPRRCVVPKKPAQSKSTLDFYILDCYSLVDFILLIALLYYYKCLKQANDVLRISNDTTFIRITCAHDVPILTSHLHSSLMKHMHFHAGYKSPLLSPTPPPTNSL